jgi:hypothetical protein
LDLSHLLENKMWRIVLIGFTPTKNVVLWEENVSDGKGSNWQGRCRSKLYSGEQKAKNKVCGVRCVSLNFSHWITDTAISYHWISYRSHIIIASFLKLHHRKNDTNFCYLHARLQASEWAKPSSQCSSWPAARVGVPVAPGSELHHGEKL